MNKKLFTIFLIIPAILILLKSIYSLINPIPVFCKYGGGIYYVNSSGEFCIVNGIAFNAIDYYNGNVPVQYNFCSHFNLSTVFKNGTYYCEYPNGTLVFPYSLIPINAYSDLIIENTTTVQKTSNYYSSTYVIYIIVGIIAGIIIYIILR